MQELKWLVQPLTQAIAIFDNKELAFGIAGAILALALVIWIFLHFGRHRRFVTPIRQLTRRLGQAREASDQPGNRLDAANDAFEQAPPAHKALWREYRKHLQEDPKAGGFVNLVDPRVWFSANALPGRGYEQWCATWAGVFLTVGLLFTFIGLSAALLKVGGIDGADSAAMKAAITGILGVSSAKFITSIAGLIAYIGFSLVTRRYQSSQQQAIAALADAVQHLSLPLTPELLLYEQNDTARKQLERLDHFTDDLAIAIDNKLKNHFEELKRGTGEMPKAIADPIISSISQLSGSIAQSNVEGLAGVLTGVGDLIGALGKVKDDMGGAGNALGTQLAGFEANLELITSTLGDTPRQINAALEQTLVRLTEAIDALVERLKQGGQDAGQTFGTSIEEAGKSFDQQVTDSSAKLSEAVAQLQLTLQGFSTRLAAVETSLNRLPEAVAAQVSQLEQAGGTFTTAGKSVLVASHALQQASAPLATTAKQLLEAVGLAQQAVIDSTDTQEKMRQSLQTTLQQLQSTAQAATQTFETHEERFGSVDEALASAIGNIQQGVEEVIRQFNEALASYNQHLTGAVNSLRSGIDNLAEAIEEIPRPAAL